jgi:hypothetical protein
MGRRARLGMQRYATRGLEEGVGTCMNGKRGPHSTPAGQPGLDGRSGVTAGPVQVNPLPGPPRPPGGPHISHRSFPSGVICFHFCPDLYATALLA